MTTLPSFQTQICSVLTVDSTCESFVLGGLLIAKLEGRRVLQSTILNCVFTLRFTFHCLCTLNNYGTRDLSLSLHLSSIMEPERLTFHCLYISHQAWSQRDLPSLTQHLSSFRSQRSFTVCMEPDTHLSFSIPLINHGLTFH